MANSKPKCKEPSCYDTPINVLRNILNKTKNRVWKNYENNSNHNVPSKKFFQNFYRKEKPPVKATIGRHCWTVLHTIAAYYPDEPSKYQKSQMITFLTGLSEFYPCVECSDHMKEYMKEHSPDVSSRDTLSLWMCQFHNDVNIRLNKPVFPCEDVLKRWYKERKGFFR